jgi:hypothetical protein
LIVDYLPGRKSQIAINNQKSTISNLIKPFKFALKSFIICTGKKAVKMGTFLKMTYIAIVLLLLGGIFAVLKTTVQDPKKTFTERFEKMVPQDPSDFDLTRTLVLLSTLLEPGADTARAANEIDRLAGELEKKSATRRTAK